MAGMGNVKQGNWLGILIYFSVMILLGAALLFAEQRLVEPVYHLPQIECTFALLIYTTFIFFWDGTNLFHLEERKAVFNNSPGNPSSGELFTEPDLLEDHLAAQEDKQELL
jgi:hypothetical protein